MTVFCGALWFGDRTSGEMLGGVTRNLEPYGAPASWSGLAGKWNASLTALGSERVPPTVTSAGAVVCADAVLHDRETLLTKLSAEVSTSDGQLIGAAYDRWGRDMFGHIEGSFAIAIVDPSRAAVLLARDHTGSRFLAVHERDDAVAFASTSLALTGFPGVGHDLDVERLAELAVIAYGTNRTFVRGVEALAPGSWRWIEDGRRTTRRWWLVDEIAISDAGSVERHATALRAELERSVASCLHGAGRVGVLLSGGLDSSSVAAVAARQLAPDKLTSYTSVPPPSWSGNVPHGWLPDERFAVEALARLTPNLAPRFIHVRGLSPFERLHDLWELGAIPARNPLNSIWYNECIRDAAADGVDVLLTGGFGNQAFSADGPLWLAELTRRLRLTTVLREAQAWSDATGKSVPATLRGLVMWPLLPRAWRRRRAESTGVDALSEWLAATAIRSDRLAGLDLSSILGDIAEPHPGGWTRDMARRFVLVGAQAEVEAVDRLRFGVEIRDPTADRRLLEVAAAQPEWRRRTMGVTRAICRAAMRDVLPREIVGRRELGAQLPDWLDRMTDARDEIGAELEELKDHPASREVFDVQRLRALFDAWPERGRMADQRAIDDYQSALMRAVVLSRYARWFEERARRVAAGGPAVLLTETM